jgi:hypothetical protein
MAQSNWVEALGSAPQASIRWAVSAAYPKPNGGGTFAYGFNSVDNITGVVALFMTQNQFCPTAKGGDISAALERGLSGGKTGFAPFLFFCLTGTDVGSNAYMLGLGDGDPSHIILRKGDLASGLPDVPAGQQGVLLQSTDSYPDEAYYHLRLEAVWNPNGDVVLNVYRSDLTVNPVNKPIWLPIPGMPQVIDDKAGITSGSPPYPAGYVGFGFRSNNVARRAFLDHIRPRAQN